MIDNNLPEETGHFQSQSPASAFHQALAAYSAATAHRHPGMSDDECEAIDSVVEPAFLTVVKSRPFSPDDIVAKGRAFLREYGGCGELRTDLVEVLLQDVRRLSQ